MKFFSSSSQFKITYIDTFDRSTLWLESETQRICFLIPILIKMCPELDGVEIRIAPSPAKDMMLEKIAFPLTVNGWEVYEITSRENKYYVVCDSFSVIEIDNRPR